MRNSHGYFSGINCGGKTVKYALASPYLPMRPNQPPFFVAGNLTRGDSAMGCICNNLVGIKVAIGYEETKRQ